MTAALTQPQAAEQRGDGLQPINFFRDLRQIADLVELCFQTQMDAGGRSAVNEMKALSYLWPMIALLVLLDRFVPGLGSGYVWRSEGRVIGNASLYHAGRHPQFGPGFLIANVAVHPDFRRHGIARAMVEAAIAKARRERGRWVALEVEADNVGAKALYQSLAFQTFETLSQWEVSIYRDSSISAPDALWPGGIHLRMPGEIAAEADLVFQRARRGALAWTHPIERHDLWDGLLDSLDSLFRAVPKEHWVMEDPSNPNRLIGALWVDNSGWRNVRLSQFLDPVVNDPEQRQLLLRTVLAQTIFDGWSLRLETTSDDPATEEFLRARGFRQTRRLTQMRLML